MAAGSRGSRSCSTSSAARSAVPVASRSRCWSRWRRCGEARSSSCASRCLRSAPIPLAYARVAIAAAVLLAIAFAQRRIPPFRTRWREFLVVGIVNSAMPFSLFCYAEQIISASAGAVLNATSPFFAAIAGARVACATGDQAQARRHDARAGRRGRRSSGWQPGAASNDVLLAVAACLVAALCYALAGVYTKRKLVGRAEPCHRVRKPGRSRAGADAAASVHHDSGTAYGARRRERRGACHRIDGDRVPHLFQAHRRRGPAARADGHVPDPALRRAVGRSCFWTSR